ncbi:hypothetical protein BOX15_Mlig002547g1 [Macrostomum lignano]|uniref:BICC1 first type I KH domain-containing protein n=1 Tax=Macrostomum lignano TaxID=282301 RepID=A0A267GLT1_9PLAT|nr:hypothetical protein BOX15_Mlig002547g1 [Macrostomum lignano]
MSTTADDTSSSSGGSSSDSFPGRHHGCIITADRVEERFRVDRRKLESLMLTSAGPTSAQEPLKLPGVCPLERFFNDIELRTGARIAWPSKLKVGAKSKRDPQTSASLAAVTGNSPAGKRNKFATSGTSAALAPHFLFFCFNKNFLALKQKLIFIFIS